jgi:hypothetical protein
MDYGARILEHSDRLDAFRWRDERTGRAPAAARPPGGRSTLRRARRITDALLIVGGLIVATIVFGLIGALAANALFILVALTLIVGLLGIGFWPALKRERPLPAYRDDMPNRDVVSRLGRMLARSRPALPAAAALRVDAIKAQLPLLESRLAERDALDPLAADARRLMGQHLPDLIERYERVPEPYRRQRDGDGMSVDERLVAGLDAACNAVESMCRDLTEKDRADFETQGRFLESRYAGEGRDG